jgi:hypothetical protein
MIAVVFSASLVKYAGINATLVMAVFARVLSPRLCLLAYT